MKGKIRENATKMRIEGEREECWSKHMVDGGVLEKNIEQRWVGISMCDEEWNKRCTRVEQLKKIIVGMGNEMLVETGSEVWDEELDGDDYGSEV